MTEKEKLQKQHAATQAAAAAARRQLHHQIQKSILNYSTSTQGGVVNNIGSGGGGTSTPTATSQTPKNPAATPHDEQPPAKKLHQLPEIDVSCVKEEPQDAISDEEVCVLYYIII